MAKKVIKLKAEFSAPNLIAISSHENDYRLCWAINEAANLSLRRERDVSFLHPKLKTEISFSRYACDSLHQEVRYQLISNRTDNAYFFDELKTFDYVFALSGEITDTFTEDIRQQLKNIEMISALMIVEAGKLKNIKWLETDY